MQFGASTQQTAEKPEPARNELVWARAVICPAAWADLLFRGRRGSRCGGLCGPHHVAGERQCHAVLRSHQYYANNATLLFWNWSLCCALLCFCFVFFFLIEESYFLCNRPFIDYRCFGVVPKLDWTAFSSVRKGRCPHITGRTGRTPSHIRVPRCEPTTTGTDEQPRRQRRTLLATRRLAGTRWLACGLGTPLRVAHRRGL